MTTEEKILDSGELPDQWRDDLFSALKEIVSDKPETTYVVVISKGSNIACYCNKRWDGLGLVKYAEHTIVSQASD